MNLKNTTTIYEKNKNEKLIIKQKNKIESFNLTLKNTSTVLTEINLIKDEINRKENHYFTGDLKIYSVPKDDDKFILASNK